MATKAKTIKTISDLTPDRANVNKGSERGAYMIDWSMTELGAGRSILADRSGNVLAGNKTLEAAAEHGFPVRVIETDGKELVVVQRRDLDLDGSDSERQKARQMAVADNRSQAVSYVEDIEMLLTHQASGVDISPMYRDDELELMKASLTPDMKEAGAGGDDFDATPEETQTRVKYGDLWECGEHRVLCGDSTKAEDVAKVMDGHKADMVFADPPYGINEETDRAEHVKTFKKQGVAKKGVYEKIIGDTNTETAEKVWDVVSPLSNTVIYWGGNYYPLPPSACWIVWDKRVEEKQTDLNSDAELAYVKHPHKASVRMFRHLWKGMIKGSEHGEARCHPTQKPVVLAEWCFENYGDPKTVLDPFGGSGMSLIACERTNRKARVIEIEPKYVNVILSRWEGETGKEAKLIERAEGEK